MLLLFVSLRAFVAALSRPAWAGRSIGDATEEGALLIAQLTPQPFTASRRTTRTVSKTLPSLKIS